ncbi:42384_t:CDS:2 [Gigaspora margarita]|uniref:42384_t:CDS:1 n=1 Tax=Gigaspora margarita TaxID=4874 RepID=A0ABN7VX43_GIGMA|nr:42384_t:CDS:2 [Gigaspora margarita]
MALDGLSCKHQAVVAIKYHSGSFNYIAALTLEDCMTYRYIACAFGHNNEINHQNVNLLNGDELNTEVIVEIETFFNRILNDIKNNQQLLSRIEHFIKRYKKSEYISVGKLAAYLFQQNSTPKNGSIRSSSKIKVQLSSVQRFNEGSPAQQRKTPIHIQLERARKERHQKRHINYRRMS